MYFKSQNHQQFDSGSELSVCRGLCNKEEELPSPPFFHKTYIISYSRSPSKYLGVKEVVNYKDLHSRCTDSGCLLDHRSQQSGRLSLENCCCLPFSWLTSLLFSAIYFFLWKENFHIDAIIWHSMEWKEKVKTANTSGYTTIVQ